MWNGYAQLMAHFREIEDEPERNLWGTGRASVAGRRRNVRLGCVRKRLVSPPAAVLPVNPAAERRTAASSSLIRRDSPASRPEANSGKPRFRLRRRPESEGRLARHRDAGLFSPHVRQRGNARPRPFTAADAKKIEELQRKLRMMRRWCRFDRIERNGAEAIRLYSGDRGRQPYANYRLSRSKTGRLRTLRRPVRRQAGHRENRERGHRRPSRRFLPLAILGRTPFPGGLRAATAPSVVASFHRARRLGRRPAVRFPAFSKTRPRSNRSPFSRAYGGPSTSRDSRPGEIPRSGRRHVHAVDLPHAIDAVFLDMRVDLGASRDLARRRDQAVVAVSSADHRKIDGARPAA